MKCDTRDMECDKHDKATQSRSVTGVIDNVTSIYPVSWQRDRQRDKAGRQQRRAREPPFSQ